MPSFSNGQALSCLSTKAEQGGIPIETTTKNNHEARTATINNHFLHFSLV